MPAPAYAQSILTPARQERAGGPDPGDPKPIPERSNLEAPVTASKTSAVVAFAVLCLSGLPGRPAAAQDAPAAANELDAFMQKVLARREVNRQTLQQYILEDRERIEVLGPSRTPLFRTSREYAWYVREGLHVRSPVRIDGVTVGESDRRKYEDDWIKRERARLERKKHKDPDKDEPEPRAPQLDPSGGAIPIATPRFVSEAYFMDFKFEAGNYYLAGREQIEGKDVLRIEYYPQHMFDDDDEHKDAKDQSASQEKESRQKDSHDRERRRERDTEAAIDRKMNKTALVTLWVDPAEYQIVKYTFDNVWMDFLPGAWLVRVDDIHASMTMGQPFPGVWLPRSMNIHAGVSLANGSFEASYSRAFSDYKLADVKSTIRVPKEARRLRSERCCGAGSSDRAVSAGLESPALQTRSHFRRAQSLDRARAGLKARPYMQTPLNLGPDGANEAIHEHGPYLADDDPQPAEIIGEIRVHGNASLNDEDVVQLANVAVGQTLDADALAAIEQRLKASGRFDSVEVRKRYRSLTNTSDVALVLVVHERPGITSMTSPVNPPSRPLHRISSRLMFLPILSYADGYGFTYGGRVSTLDLLGAGERLSVPLTWGGTRRAALEVERTFKSGPITRVDSSIAIWNRENPRFEVRDQRVEWKARAERHFFHLMRAGIDTSTSSVEFGALDDHLWTLGTNIVFDSRGDPAFPRNAIVAGAGWTGLHFRSVADRIDRYTTDLRGYLGVVRQLVLAGRVQYVAASATLPSYERLLLGGSPTLRGFEAGAFDGDRTFVASAELRVPITSVLSSARLGVTAFVDTGKAYDFDTRFDDAVWHRGVGAGVFLIAPLVKINLDVAHGLNNGDTRVHLSSGFSF